MGAAAIPTFEAKRLKALEDLKILDTEADATYDAITAVASHIMDTPMAIISMIDDHRQWYKSSVGMGNIKEVNRDETFCAHALLDPFNTLVVPDATKDIRFADNPSVIEDNGIRFYVGEPLLTQDNMPIGTICAIDRVVRPKPTPGQLESLRNLARLVMSHLELRKMILEISDEVQKLTTIDMQTQNAYDELNAKCDLVLEKIKARKAERKKRLAEN